MIYGTPKTPYACGAEPGNSPLFSAMARGSTINGLGYDRDCAKKESPLHHSG